MSVDGSRGSAAIFPMICCAKLAGIFEQKVKACNGFEQALNMEYEIWIDLGRHCSD